MSSPGAVTLGGRLSDVFTDNKQTSPAANAPLSTRFKWALVIRRIEFLPVHVTIGLVPLVLGAHSFGELGSLNAILAFLFAVTHMEMADMLNALADREVDATYKARQPEAIYGLGIRKVIGHFIATSAVYLGIGVFLAVRTGHWDLIALAVFGWLVGVQYSLPPLFLKGAGVWQLPSLQLGCVLIPGLFVLRSFDHGLEWGAVLIDLGLALALTATFVTNHAEDYREDEQFGIKTYVRAWGIPRAMVVQTSMLLIGSALVLGAAYLAYGFSWGLLPYAVGWLVTQRFMVKVCFAVRPSLDAGIEVVRKYALIGPYHGVAMGMLNVVLAVAVLTGR